MRKLVRRKFLSRTASTLGLGLIAQLVIGQRALAQTWKKIESTTGTPGTWQKLCMAPTVIPKGKPLAWGTNYEGQLGDNSITCRLTPVAVCGITNAIAIASGSSHSVALLSDGTLRSWGGGSVGRLGDNTTANKSTPVAVCGITNAIAVATGAYHSFVLLSDGTLRGWGCGQCGQLGNNATTNQSTPVAVCGITSAIAVRVPVGQPLSSNHSLALLSDGTIRAWGNGGSGQLGNNATAPQSTPVAVCGITNAIALAGGSGYSLALLANGTVRSWGAGFCGALGNNSTAYRSTPVAVCGITNAIAVATGTFHSLALLSDGTIRAWGNGENGLLGNNDASTCYSTPVAVCGITNAIAIAGGCSHSLALLSNGTIMAWGRGNSGSLGVNSTTNWSTPVAVCEITSAVAIAAAWAGSMAL